MQSENNTLINIGTIADLLAEAVLRRKPYGKEADHMNWTWRSLSLNCVPRL